MKSFWQLFICFSIIACPREICAESDSAKRANQYSNIPVRVLLGRESQSFTVQSESHTLFLGNFPLKSWKRLEKRAEVMMTLGPKKRPAMLINGDLYPLQPFYLRGGQFSSDGIRFKQGTYRGLLKFIPNEAGWFVINILPIETYLAGTLASEMGANWEIEALKAQAVASRTYALYMTAHPKNQNYDLVGTMLDQVYGGAKKESPRVLKAISATHGEFLGFDESPAKIFFHARCGGKTETENAVWNNTRANHLSVDCPYCQTHRYQWTSSVPLADLLEAVHLPFSSKNSLNITSATTSPSGRIIALRFKAGENEKVLNTDVFRNLVGYSQIKSARLQWRVTGDAIRFSGTGMGHGVGMCQWGANYLAKIGKTYHDILSHYYPAFTLYEPQTVPNIPSFPRYKAIARADNGSKPVAVE